MPPEAAPVWSSADARAMARALRLARRGQGTTHPNPAVGCVLIRDGEIVGEGYHRRAGEPHAEVHALRAAGARARGAAAFVSLEPCAHTGRTPPCTEALIDAGVSRVVAAVEDPDPRTAGRGLQALRSAGVVTACGLMAEAARELNRGFFQRLQQGRPFLTLKLAASIDGRTAMASGESQWISSPQARADVHRLRALHHGVLTSADTILADDPQLTVRSPGVGAEDLATGAAVGGLRQPDRIVLDARGRVPASARVWAADGAGRWWLGGEHPRREALAAAGVRLLQPPLAGAHLDLPAALAALAGEGINDLLVECGPRLAGALLQAGLVDELLLYVAPRLLGEAARPLAALSGLERLADGPMLAWQEVRRIGPDLRLRALCRRAADG